MDDWQIGDLALCVKGGAPLWVEGLCENGATYNLVEGRINTVDRIDVVNGYTGLHFEGLDWAWFATRFIKVTPTDPDEFDREVIELMTRAPVAQPIQFTSGREVSAAAEVPIAAAATFSTGACRNAGARLQPIPFGAGPLDGEATATACLPVPSHPRHDTPRDLAECDRSAGVVTFTHNN